MGRLCRVECPPEGHSGGDSFCALSHSRPPRFFNELDTDYSPRRALSGGDTPLPRYPIARVFHGIFARSMLPIPSEANGEARYGARSLPPHLPTAPPPLIRQAKGLRG